MAICDQVRYQVSGTYNQDFVDMLVRTPTLRNENWTLTYVPVQAGGNLQLYSEKEQHYAGHSKRSKYNYRLQHRLCCDTCPSILDVCQGCMPYSMSCCCYYIMLLLLCYIIVAMLCYCYAMLYAMLILCCMLSCEV